MSATLRPLLLALAVLTLAPAAQAQDQSFGWYIEEPGPAPRRPARARAGRPVESYVIPWSPPRRIARGPAWSPAPSFSPPVTARTWSSTTVTTYRPGGYHRGSYFPRGNGFGHRREYRGGWLMPHRFSIGRSGYHGYGRR